jgi:multidrug efflux system outer membrane protein
MASEAFKQGTMLSLVSQISTSYFNILDYKYRLEVSKSTLESRQKMLDIMEARFKHGYIPEIDLNQAQIQVSIAMASIPYYKRLLVIEQNYLSILLGEQPHKFDFQKNIMDVDSIAMIPVGVPSKLLERRPDVLQSEYQLIQQNANVGVAVSQRFPSLSLSAGGGLVSNDVTNLLSQPFTWNIMGALTGPIFNFNKNKRRVDVEREKTIQAVYSYKNTVLHAFKGVEDALIQIETLKLELAARDAQVKAASNALMLSENRYDKGVTSYLEVLEQQRTLFESQLTASSIRQQYVNSYVKLYKELGGGWFINQ